MALTKLSSTFLLLISLSATATLAQFVEASPATATVPIASASSPWLTTATPTSDAAYHPSSAAWSMGKSKFPSYFGKAKIAHAALGAAAFLVFFPLGGIIVKVWPHRHIVWIHAAIQAFGLAVFVASTGLGIWMGMKLDAVDHYHCVIGLVILGLLVLQPLMKLHWFHEKFPKVAHFVHIHLWLGRALILLGIVDGGLGFQFAATFKGAKWASGWKIAYGVCGALVWLIYVSVVIVWVEMKKPDASMSRIVENEEMVALSQDRGRAGDRPKTADTVTSTLHDVESGEALPVEPVRPVRPARL